MLHTSQTAGGWELERRVIGLQAGPCTKTKHIKESMRPIKGGLHTPSFSVNDIFITSHSHHHLAIQQRKLEQAQKVT